MEIIDDYLHVGNVIGRNASVARENVSSIAQPRLWLSLGHRVACTGVDLADVAAPLAARTKAQRQSKERLAKAILLSLYHAKATELLTGTAYRYVSRHNGAEKLNRNWRVASDTRGRVRPITRTSLIEVLDTLHDAGWIRQEKGGRPQDRSEYRGKCWLHPKHGWIGIATEDGDEDNFRRPTRLIATDKLMETLAGTGVKREYFRHVIKKDGDTIIEYPPSSLSRRLNKEVMALNDALAKHRVNIYIDKKTLDVLERPIDLTKNVLTRVFNRNSWQLGGRFYGHWVQNITNKAYEALDESTGEIRRIDRRYRRLVTIDGEPTVEIDYCSQHIRMLYASERVQVIGDPYSIEPLSPLPNMTSRGTAKILMLIMINIQNEQAALAAVVEKHHAVINEGREALGLPIIPRVKQTEVRSRLEVVKQHHAQIARYFFADEGIKLQYLDSCIALEVMQTLTAKGMACIPIHDSFIVRHDHADILKQAMADAWRKHVGTDAVMKTDISNLVIDSNDSVYPDWSEREQIL